MRSLFIVFVIFVSGCISVDVSLFGKEGELKEHNLTGKGYDQKILLISIDGIIHNERFSTMFHRPSSTPAYIEEQLRKAEEDKSICAVVLRISSPGGEVSASDTIYEQLSDFKERTGKPIVAHFMDIGTSGAYYIACAADRITAQPTAVTGSIGVIVHLFNVEKLMEKIGVSVDVLKSGKRKDSGSPFRRLTEQERASFQKLIDGMFERFVNIVRKSRRLDTQKLKTVTDGRVIPASEAITLGLIDEVCYLDDALKAAKKLAGVKNADVILYERPGRRRSGLYAPFALSSFEKKVSEMLRPGFYYIDERFFWNSE